MFGKPKYRNEFWTDELMDAANNVGTTLPLLQDEFDDKQLVILFSRFQKVEKDKALFMIDEINYEAIQQEVKKVEKKYKWKEFFNRSPLSEYIDIENRVVTNVENALLCTNSVKEANEFLKNI